MLLFSFWHWIPTSFCSNLIVLTKAISKQILKYIPSRLLRRRYLGILHGCVCGNAAELTVKVITLPKSFVDSYRRLNLGYGSELSDPVFIGDQFALCSSM